MAVLGSILNVVPRVPEGRDNLLVLVQEPTDHGIKGAGEISREVVGHKEPLRDLRSYFFWVNGHSKANAVQRGPAESEDHKHHEQSSGRRWAWGAAWSQ